MEEHELEKKILLTTRKKDNVTAYCVTTHRGLFWEENPIYFTKKETIEKLRELIHVVQYRKEDIMTIRDPDLGDPLKKDELERIIKAI